MLPVLAQAPADPERYLVEEPGVPLLDVFMRDLAVGYSFGPPFGTRAVTWDDLDRLDMSRRELRQYAADTLDQMLPTVHVHGRPPTLMLSFAGLESSLLLARQFWNRFARSVPGELVVGVPARDVVIVTGSHSQAGLAKARRAVDRVFYAGGPNLLTPRLLVRREGVWRPLEPSRPAPELLRREVRR